MPEPAFKPIGAGVPQKLDCSGVGLDDDQELWLMQFPVDVSLDVWGEAAASDRVPLSLLLKACALPITSMQFPTNASVEWKMGGDARDGVRGRCTVNGVLR